jgi:hypothetical protein
LNIKNTAVDTIINCGIFLTESKTAKQKAITTDVVMTFSVYEFIG